MSKFCHQVKPPTRAKSASTYPSSQGKCCTFSLLPSFISRGSHFYSLARIKNTKIRGRLQKPPTPPVLLQTKTRALITPILPHFYPLIARKCCASFLLPSFISRRLAYPSLSPPFSPKAVKEKTGDIILPKRQAFLPQKIRRFFL